MSSTLSTASKRKVICVDDNEMVLEAISDLIRDMGFEVITAASANQCMELIKPIALQVLFVVSDYNMPGKNGFELRKELLLEYHDIPFFILSGELTKEMAIAGIDLGITAFLEKPIDVQRLTDVLREKTKYRLESMIEDEDLIASFIVDSEKLIEEMEELLLELEENPTDIDRINRVFACAHTVKGSSGFLKPDFLHKFMHRYEDYFSQFKRRPELLNGQAVSVLLQGLDITRDLVRKMSARTLDMIDVESLCDIFSSNQKEETQSKENAESIMEMAKKEGGSRSDQKEAAKASKKDEIRVSMKVLDEFMERSGELTVLRNMINKVVRVIEQEYSENKDVATLSELLEEMHKTNGLLQEKVSDLRKTPLNHVFRPLQRTVRDLASTLGKQIQMLTVGDDLHIDHVLADVLNKCLIHMVRNSADHGIESPTIRESLGKPAVGTLRISAEEVNGEIHIAIQDDGKGIDPGIVRKKAIEKGLSTEQNLAAKSDGEILLLIFEPGFSTASEVTDVSGRGVGTDMVLKSVQAVGGRIVIDSKVGQGTKFQIVLPIPKSVLIIDSLFVGSEGNVYGIPQDKIRRVICLTGEDVNSRVRDLNKQKVIEVDSKLLPVIDLREVLEISRIDDSSVKTKSPATLDDSGEPLTLVSVESKGREFCLQVDEIGDIEDTVVRRLNRDLNYLAEFLGATFLGDGNIGLLLNIDGVADKLNLSNQVNARLDTYLRDDVPVYGLDSFILVRLNELGLFALPQSDIVRLEEFSTEHIEFSGKQPVVIYRDSPLPLYGLECLIGLHRTQGYFESDRVFALICKKEERLFGLMVDKILDLVAHTPISTRKEDGECFTRSVINGSTVGIVRLEDLKEWNNLFQPLATRSSFLKAII